MDTKKIAIVHDWLTNMGGAEKVIESFINIYPEAPIYTLMVNKGNLSEKFQDREIIPSFLQKKMSKKKPNHQKFLPFMPMAFESFDLNEYDVILSSTSSCAKGVVTRPDTVHICYCHTPMRYAWEFYYEYTENIGGLKKKLLKYAMNYIRLWDRVAADRVDYFIANSQYVANRIWKHYRRKSTVIYPPVNTEYYTPEGEKEEIYLCLSRLVQYKKVDLAVEAFNRIGKKLVVIGGGEQLDYLKSIAKPNIIFLGRQPDEVVREYYRKCKAFIFPGEEDFGITPVEAQACGTPVIAYGKGGATETVIDGITGVFFKEQTEESLIDAVDRFEKISIDSGVCRENAEKFGIERFEHQMKNYVEYCCQHKTVHQNEIDIENF